MGLSDLAIFPLLDGLLQWSQVLLRLRGGPDHPLIHSIKLLRQLLAQLLVFLSQSARPG